MRHAVPNPNKKQGMIPFALILVLALATACDSHSGSASFGEMEVESAWIPMPPPGAPAAAYFELSNGTESAQTIVGAHSDAAGRVELHETVITDGIARMQPLSSLALRPGESLSFAPRGRHVMLFDPKPMTAESRIEIVLEMESGSEILVQAEVRGMQVGEKPMDHSDHSGHH